MGGYTYLQGRNKRVFLEILKQDIENFLLVFYLINLINKFGILFNCNKKLIFLEQNARIWTLLVSN